MKYKNLNHNRINIVTTSNLQEKTLAYFCAHLINSLKGAWIFA